MKVITPGTPDWPRRLHCTGDGNGGGGCGAELLVELDDLRHTTRQGYGDDRPSGFVTFRCDECGALTDPKGPRLPYWGDLPKMEGRWSPPWRKPEPS